MWAAIGLERISKYTVDPVTVLLICCKLRNTYALLRKISLDKVSITNQFGPNQREKVLMFSYECLRISRSGVRVPFAVPKKNDPNLIAGFGLFLCLDGREQ